MMGAERNVIGGFTATVLTPMIDGWAKLLPYIIFAIILILADLRYGLKAARKRGEEIRRSRAWRRSLNKLVVNLFSGLIIHFLKHLDVL